jgi:hypothetical protein
MESFSRNMPETVPWRLQQVSSERIDIDAESDDNIIVTVDLPANASRDGDKGVLARDTETTSFDDKSHDSDTFNEEDGSHDGSSLQEDDEPGMVQISQQDVLVMGVLAAIVVMFLITLVLVLVLVPRNVDVVEPTMLTSLASTLVKEAQHGMGVAGLTQSTEIAALSQCSSSLDYDTMRFWDGRLSYGIQIM